MKATQLATLGIIPAALLITACGDDVTKVTKIEGTSGMEVVASADSLGKCTAEISGEMKFATKGNAVYVCADSVWKNVSKTEKMICSAETLADSSGFKIVCDGDSVGVIRDGIDGKDGEKGKAGDACDISDNGDGTVSVVCGDASTILYKAFCGGKLFNPDSSFCFADSIIPLCGGESYDLDESFCFANSVVPLCGGKSYDLDSSFCYSGLVVPQSKKLVWDLMNPEVEYELFTDARDGQIYRSVKIGEQTWMAENLNYAYRPDSLSFCYNDSSENCQKYGRLYTGVAASFFSCPEGWHLPDTIEFKALSAAIGGMEVSGKSLKSASGWKNDGGGLDSYGFSAFPAGMRYGEDDFDELGYTANFWSASLLENPASLFIKGIYLLSLNFSSDIADLKYEKLDYAFSVRCVRD